MVSTGFLWLTVGLLVLCAAVHSALGEQRLLRPMFARRGNPVLERDLARMVLRLAWHVTAVGWLLLGAVLVLVHDAANPAARPVLAATGMVFLGVGLVDAVATRGRHVGWPILSAIGLCALASGWTL